MEYNFLRKEYSPNFTIFRNLDEITSVQETMKKFLKDNGFDENKLEICLAGGSAGAHLALLYSYWFGKSSPIPIKFVYNIVGPVTLEFDYWWQYKKGLEPLEGIEPMDIQMAKDKNLIEDNKNMFYNNTILTFLMNSFLGKGFEHNIKYMIIDYATLDIDRNNANFTKLLDEVKILFPVNHIDKNTLPTLCFYGGKDVDVGIAQYSYLRTKFNESNNNNNLTLIYSKFSDHSNIETNTTEGKKAKEDLDSKFIEFTNKYFSKD